MLWYVGWCMDWICVECTREKPYNLCHLRDLWINIIIFLYFVIISWTQQFATLNSTTGTNVRYIIIVLSAQQCTHRCKYLTFLHRALDLSRCKNQKRTQNISHASKFKWMESDKKGAGKKARRTKNDTRIQRTNEGNCTKKSLCICEILPRRTTHNILHHMCVRVFVYGVFFLRCIYFSACKPNAILLLSATTEQPWTVCSLFRENGCKLEKARCAASEIAMQLFVLLTHVIWFLMHQIGNFCWKHCGTKSIPFNLLNAYDTIEIYYKFGNCIHDSTLIIHEYESDWKFNCINSTEFNRFQSFYP